MDLIYILLFIITQSVIMISVYHTMSKVSSKLNVLTYTVRDMRSKEVARWHQINVGYNFDADPENVWECTNCHWQVKQTNIPELRYCQKCGSFMINANFDTSKLLNREESYGR